MQISQIQRYFSTSLIEVLDNSLQLEHDLKCDSEPSRPAGPTSLSSCTLCCLVPPAALIPEIQQADYN